MRIELFLLLLLNVLSFLLYAYDKGLAVKKRSRISERLLLIMGVLGGIGAWLGMQLLRHKTKHLKFQLLVPLFAAFQIYLFYLLLR